MEGHREPCNEVVYQSPAQRISGITIGYLPMVRTTHYPNMLLSLMFERVLNTPLQVGIYLLKDNNRNTRRNYEIRSHFWAKGFFIKGPFLNDLYDKLQCLCWLTHFFPMFPSDPPENIRKPNSVKKKQKQIFWLICWYLICIRMQNPHKIIFSSSTDVVVSL